jgi:hypothetical protein
MHDLADVVESRTTLRALERPDDDLAGGDEKKCERVGEEGQQR